jgi:RHS repeat-associated protein
MLDNLDLVHMNGRVYDPLIGRFISADPFVQEPLFSQSLNRYSYVANNPLSYVDPSGYSWLSKAWRKLKRAYDSFRAAFKSAIPQIVGAIVFVACEIIAYGSDGGSGCGSAALWAMAATASIVGGGNEIRGPPGSGSTSSHGGRAATGGASLPPGVIVSIRPSGGNADGGQRDDLYGDPLFDTIIDVLKGVLIPGYDLYRVFQNPTATWVDWAEAIASTAVSLIPPAKLMSLAVKLYKTAKRARSGQKALALVDKTIDQAKVAELRKLPIKDRAGNDIGRFIADTRGNVMLEPAGGKTVSAGRSGIDTHTLYPNGSNYQRLNPRGHGPNGTPHAHGHAPGTGPGMRGQGPSLDVDGNVVPWNSPDAHWPIN